MKRPILFILALLATGPGAWGAELVHLTDGSTRRGRVEKWDDQGVQLRVEGDGIRVEMLIPATKVA